MSLFSSLRESTAPPVAVEIAAGRVSAAALEWRGGQPVVALHAIEPMPEGALVPSLTTTNTHDRSAVMTALNRVLDKMGRPRRISLAIPDVVAKVSLVRFEKVPPRQVDLEQLVRWQVRKSAPFPIEEAQVAYVPGIRADDGQEFIVSLARRENINEYEQLCAEAGAHAGLVDLSTFNVINAVLASSGAPTTGPSAASGPSRAQSTDDWLLVHVSADSTSIALLRGPQATAAQSRRAPRRAGGRDRSEGGRRAHRSHHGRSGAARFARAARRTAAARSRNADGAGMIRSNLSTRPFYNERAVRFWLLVLAVLLAAATAFNISRVLRYSHSDTQLAMQATRDENRAADLRQQANRLRATVDPKQLEFASTETRQANELIDRRPFSWTELLNRLETTLPPDVHIVALRPKVDRKNGTVLTINVLARSVDDVDVFMNNLEATGAFRSIGSREDHFNEQGLLESSIESTYVPASAKEPAKP